MPLRRRSTEGLDVLHRRQSTQSLLARCGLVRLVLPMRTRGSHIAALSLLTLVLLLGALAPVASYPGGISGQSEKGCTCHSATPTASVSAQLSGVPTTYTPGATYDLTVTVGGGPTPGGSNAGGFDLSVTSGTLAVPANATDVQIKSGEATHTSVGNDNRTWKVRWVAPTSGSVTFHLAVNAVDGDGSPSSADQWNSASVTTKPVGDDGETEEKPAPGFEVVMAFTAVAVGVLLLSGRRAMRAQ